MEKKEERPWCMITEMDQYLFGQGTHYEIYKKLGAHLTEYEGETRQIHLLFMRKSVRERLHVWRISVDLPGMMTAG